jgi:hypothetical protein
MYEKDPRREWEPLLAYRFGLQPWHMYDLTPIEFEAYVAVVEMEQRNPLG